MAIYENIDEILYRGKKMIDSAHSLAAQLADTVESVKQLQGLGSNDAAEDLKGKLMEQANALAVEVVTAGASLREAWLSEKPIESTRPEVIEAAVREKAFQDNLALRAQLEAEAQKLQTDSIEAERVKKEQTAAAEVAALAERRKKDREAENFARASFKMPLLPENPDDGDQPILTEAVPAPAIGSEGKE